MKSEVEKKDLKEMKQNIFEEYVAHYRKVREYEVYKTPEEFSQLKESNFDEFFIVRDLPNKKDGVVLIQKGYHTNLSTKLDKISKISKEIATHPYVLLSSIGGVVATALSSNPAFAIMGVSALTSLGVLSVVAKKINEKVVENNIERMATKIAEEKISNIEENTHKKGVLDSIENLRESVNNIKPSNLLKNT